MKKCSARIINLCKESRWKDMGLFSFINDKIHTNCKKSKDTSYPNKSYKDGKYRVGDHAVMRMNQRQITKGELHVNLHTKPIKITSIKHTEDGPSYERYSKNKINSRINPETDNVNTVSRFHTSKYNKIMKGKKK